VDERLLSGSLLPSGSRSSTWTPLGIGGPDVEPVGVDLFDAGPHLLLVSGPAGSGRTTAAAWIVQAMRRRGVPVLVLAPPRSPLPGLLPADDDIRIVQGSTVHDTDLRVAASTFGERRFAVVVDDCEQLNVLCEQDRYHDRPTLLADIAEPSALGRQALVMVGDAGPIVSGQRRNLLRVVNEILSTGTRVILAPTSPALARELHLTLEADQYFPGPAGRGYLTNGREAHLVQLAHPVVPPDHDARGFDPPIHKTARPSMLVPRS
jgi:S-DNA-T family DNA segregation ATPase FtsK/SpoIIIE